MIFLLINLPFQATPVPNGQIMMFMSSGAIFQSGIRLSCFFPQELKDDHATETQVNPLSLFGGLAPLYSHRT